jgi:hypothetical protein
MISESKALSLMRVVVPPCRLYGHHTTEHPLWGWVKDLSRLGRDLSRTLIVDDSVLAALLQPCSLVPIRPFDHADPRKDRDTALTELLRFLQDKVGGVVRAMHSYQSMTTYRKGGSCRTR